MQVEVDGEKGDAVEKELKELDKALEEALQQEQAKVDAAIRELARRKAHALAQKKSEGLSEKELEELRVMLDDEESTEVHAMRSRMEERVQKRRRDKKLQLQRKLDLQYKRKEDALKAEYDELKAENNRKIQEEAAQLKEVKSRLSSSQDKSSSGGAKLSQLQSAFATKMREKRKNQPASPVSPTARGEQQSGGVSAEAVGQRVEEATAPMLERLERMESLLRQHTSTPVYHDPREASWAKASSGNTVKIEEQMTPKQSQVHEMTSTVLSRLQPTGLKRLKTVVPAAQLPRADMAGNAFSESYRYDPATGELAVRSERLENPGEMMLLLAHANAHVKSGVMDTDSDPTFQREFYAGLVTLMEETLGSSRDGKLKGILDLSLAILVVIS